MRTGFRHADPRHGFLWETSAQPAARWHARGEGPAHYLADTPLGAWAEFVRHENLTEPEDLDDVSRSLWAVQVEDSELVDATCLSLPHDLGEDGYPDCRDAARAARAHGADAVQAPSAAVLPGGASGWVCDDGMRRSVPADGQVWVLFGHRPDLRGWLCVERGSPPPEVLDVVRHL